MVWEHHEVKTNGIRLHVVQAGLQEGPLVILLHGFPEYWFGWRHQIGALARAGYRVWVPDQRGYNLSDKPRGLDAYRMDVLADDVEGLIDAAGRDTASIVGHDWGANIAWQLALKSPHRLERLVIVNVPHPTVFHDTLRDKPKQWLKSSYIAFFQLPGLPEWTARFANWRLPAQMLIATSRPDTFTPRELDLYRQAWAQPGAYTAMLNWYRAALRRPLPLPLDPIIRVPTLMLWGAKDAFLDASMAPRSIRCCPGGKLMLFKNATHWLLHEEPARVNAALLNFLDRAD